MRSDKSNRLGGIALLAALLLNFPILGIFDPGGLVFGLPVLYLYLFIIWIFIIVSIWLIVKKFEPRNR